MKHLYNTTNTFKFSRLWVLLWSIQETQNNREDSGPGSLTHNSSIAQSHDLTLSPGPLKAR